jgi:hypothetical protein
MSSSVPVVCEPADLEKKHEKEPAAEHICCWCPNCAAKLESSRCKLVCRGCGYYMSCADYY